MEKTKSLPLSFYVCSITSAFERSAYYASKFLIYIFLLTAIGEGGLGLDKSIAGAAQADLVAFTYLAPIIGGYLCDRFVPARIAIPLGMFFMGAGYYFGSIAQNIDQVYIMIWLVVIGTGLFKGNLSALVGRLVNDEDKLDTAFSTQYAFINIGSFVGTTVVGILYTRTFFNAETGELGFSQSFFVASVVCFIAGIFFMLSSKFFGEYGKKPFGADAKKADTKTTFDPLTLSEKKRVLAICIVSVFSVVFWIFWYLTYLAAYDYGATYTNMFVGGFEVPLVWFDSLNAFACIVLGPLFGVLWYKLSKRPKGDISLFKKTGIGLGFLGIAFLMLIGGEITRGTGQASIIWLTLFGILLTIGEMFFSPLGYSFVSKYAPSKFLAALMGVWIIATFFAGKLYSPIYDLLYNNFSVTGYSLVVFAILMVSGLTVFLADGKLSKLLSED